MGRTRNLPFLPTCGSPSKTLSFRASTAASTATATAISGEFDDMFATGDDVESVIRGLRTDRFFFNPGETSSILEESKPKEKNKVKNKDKEKEKESVLAFKESVSMMEMESTDPFVDFKKSMQEMMEADEGLKQWDNLQELLSLYLAVNDKLNHGYIIGAFVDLLLVNLGSPSKPSSSSSCSSSTINCQKQSLLMESGVGINQIKNDKLTMMNSSDSPESGLSFTSSFASSSGICSSTSHFLSSCSLEDEEEEDDDDDDDDGDNHGDDEDHNSPQKASVSDHPSCLKV